MSYLKELQISNPGMPAQDALIKACCEVDRLRFFILEARKDSDLVILPGGNAGAKVLVPYWFMKDDDPPTQSDPSLTHEPQ